MMLIFDSAWIVAYMAMLIAGWQYIQQAKTSPARSGIVFQHWLAHTLPVLGFTFFACVGVVFASLHAISQNITHWPPLDTIEYGQAVAGIGVLVCATSYINHARDEETPEHPFYLGEHDAQSDD